MPPVGERFRVSFVRHSSQDVLKDSAVCDIDLSDLEPKGEIYVTAYKDGKKLEFKTICRVDVPAEVEYIANGGILQYVLRRMANE